MRNISVADYFVEFLIANEVTDVFGYQGGMIAYIFDSLGKYRDKINYHSCATEQGAALAACGYSQSTHKLGVAISTSGPGFTNMITGIADAWCDSIPVLFLSGNVNTKDKKRKKNIRQLGFQEIQSVSIAKNITKRTYEVELGQDYENIFENAYITAMSGRKGPVFIDLPINICRERINVDIVNKIKLNELFVKTEKVDKEVNLIINDLNTYKKPLIIAGDGIRQADAIEEFNKLVDLLQIPVVTTLPAIDVLPSTSEYRLGYMGGTARREAGIALQNADCVITIGTRLCSKQIGHNMELFIPMTKKIYRVDIDEGELDRRVKSEEIQIRIDVKVFLQRFLRILRQRNYSSRHNEWVKRCSGLCGVLKNVDITLGNSLANQITCQFPEDANIVLDVGKNLTYCGQSAVIKNNTQVYMSAGLGTMGYALPAAIGIYYGNHRPTYVIMGDGGAQMNIQELNTIVKNKLPITIIILNNKALGNIRIFQEQYLDSRYVATSEKENDYFSCNFAEIGKAYGIKTKSIKILDEKPTIKIYESELMEIIYNDCPVLPGIVAGGEYLKADDELDDAKIDKIRRFMDY